MDYKKILSQKLDILIENKKDESYHNSVPVQAKDMGISYPTLTHYINGDSACSTTSLVKIANYYGVSTDYLLGNTKNPTTNRNLDIVYDYTRLSRESLKRLNTCKSNFIDILNSLLENNNFWRLLDKISQYKKLSNSVVPFEKWLNDGVYVSCDDLVDENPIETINKRDLTLFQIQEIIKDIAKDGEENGNNK